MAQFRMEISKFTNFQKIGEGTYGKVYKAIDKSTNREVALKRIMLGNEIEGFPMTALREIRILQRLRHQNIVEMIEVCRTMPSKENSYLSEFFLVLEFCEHDLAGLLSNENVRFKLAELKMIIKQLLEGLYFIHTNKMLHRDLKPANILMTKKGIVKLADFGLARPVSDRSHGKNCLTNKVVTLWYRSPEVLLGTRNYGPPIDMWAAGCIMAELWTRSAILQGRTEQQQLNMITHLCGSITKCVWPTVDNLALFNRMELPKNSQRKVIDRMRSFIKDANGCDLLDALLTLDPTKRIDADNALNHAFFWVDPMPTSLENVMMEHKESMFQFLTMSKQKLQQCSQPQPQQQWQYQQQRHKMNNTAQPQGKIDSGYYDIIY